MCDVCCGPIGMDGYILRRRNRASKICSNCQRSSVSFRVCAAGMAGEADLIVVSVGGVMALCIPR